MSGKSMGFGLALLIAIGLALGYSGWQMVRSQAEQSCGVCGRPVPHTALSRALGQPIGQFARDSAW